MSQKILLFDMDGVLLEPGGYHKALTETVRLIGESLGYKNVELTPADIAAFEAAGTEPFSYQRGGKQQALKTLWRVPDEIMDDVDDLLSWSRTAVDAALAATRAKSKK